MKKKWIVIVLLFFSGSFLIASLDGIGITWDEPIYITHTIIQGRWLLSPHPFSRETVLQFWPDETHPPFGRIFMAGGIFLLSPFFDLVVSARMGAIVISSFLIIAVFLIISRQYGELAGIFGSLSLLFIPRLWGHFHLAGLDIPLTLMVFLASFAFFKGTGSLSGKNISQGLTSRKEFLEGLRWSILSGILWGLAFSTKATAILFIPPIFIWAFIYRKGRYQNNLISLSLISPLLFIILWPRMWFDTGRELLQFLSQQVMRMPIPVYYFGTIYGKEVSTPWHYPLVMFSITIPVVTLIFILLGLMRLLKEKLKDDFGTFCLIITIFFLIIVSSPFYPKYDGIRLFLPIVPFFLCIGCKGFRYIQERIKKKMFIYVLLFISILPGLVSIITIHPFYLSHYNFLIGGVKGAHKHGMESTYWGDAINERVIQFINKKAPQVRIGIYPIGCFQLKYLQASVRKDLSLIDSYANEIDYFVLHCRQGMFNEELWNIYNYAKPLFIQSVGGVPLVKIYEKEEILPFLGIKK